MNCKKSKMMNITDGTETLNEGDLLVARESGDAPKTLKGVNTHTYLGVQLGKSTGVTLHWKENTRMITRQANILKAKAGQSFTRFLTGRVLWRNQAVKQKVIYATEVMHRD